MRFPRKLLLFLIFTLLIGNGFVYGISQLQSNFSSPINFEVENSYKSEGQINQVILQENNIVHIIGKGEGFTPDYWQLEKLDHQGIRRWSKNISGIHNQFQPTIVASNDKYILLDTEGGKIYSRTELDNSTRLFDIYNQKGNLVHSINLNISYNQYLNSGFQYLFNYQGFISGNKAVILETFTKISDSSNLNGWILRSYLLDLNTFNVEKRILQRQAENQQLNVKLYRQSDKIIILAYNPVGPQSSSINITSYEYFNEKVNVVQTEILQCGNKRTCRPLYYDLGRIYTISKERSGSPLISTTLSIWDKNWLFDYTYNYSNIFFDMLRFDNNTIISYGSAKPNRIQNREQTRINSPYLGAIRKEKNSFDLLSIEILSQDYDYSIISDVEKRNGHNQLIIANTYIHNNLTMGSSIYLINYEVQSNLILKNIKSLTYFQVNLFIIFPVIIYYVYKVRKYRNAPDDQQTPYPRPEKSP